MNRLDSAVRAEETTIVVTGLGAISAGGDTPAALWEAVRRGESPAARYTDPGVADGLAIPACAVSRLAPTALPAHRSQKLDRCVQLALEAAGQAITDAGLAHKSPNPPRLGVFVGTSRGPLQKVGEMLALLQQGRRLPPSLSAHSTLACLSGTLALAFEAKGPCLTVSATCASAGHAIALAAQQLVLGTADAVLAGGAEAALQDCIIRQLAATGVLGSHDDPRLACRPFDVTRNGIILGEGAGFLVLETQAAARRRGATIHARLAGWAIGTENYHYTAPSETGDGLFQVMSEAVAQADARPDELDYINLHGTGTALNDRLEAVALRRLLGERLGAVPCSTTKPITGHCLGATPALEAVISILALQRQYIPPTANCRQQDPECPLDVVPLQGRPAALRRVLSNSVGFWGNNAALVFTKDEG
jgi:3-oxoacyl-[acyl-carrier-protein] synthase II